MGTGIAAYSGEAIDTNEWAHIAGTYDGTTARIYINGVETGSRTGSITIENNSLDLQIGGSYGSSFTSPNTGEEYFNGNIDEVLLFNRALSPEEIAQLAN